MKLTWFGHSAFRVEVGSSVILIDPFLSGNSSFEGDVMVAAKGATHIALTHGHFDHVGDSIEIAEKTGASVIAVFELAGHLGEKADITTEPMATGGSLYFDDFNISMVRADHSSSLEGVYTGCPAGFIIRAKKEEKTLYHMGDTDIFSDMALINELYKPDIGIVPIGDRFTMSPCSAALACTRYFDFETIIPCHFGTWPLLTGTPEDFAQGLGNAKDKLSVMSVGDTLVL